MALSAGGGALMATIARAHAALRAHALTYPQTKEDFPWGETAIKVNGKVFLFMYLAKDALNLSVKLPVSGKVALALPFASPTGYSLGKSGWVTARFAAKDAVPVDRWKGWVDASCRGVAPKRVVARLEGG